MKIEMFPAENGDAFLISVNKKNIIIDMGYRTTYNNYIKNRLIDLNSKGESIDLLVITHIDEDHIEGAIEFFRDNGSVSDSNIIDVKEIWHNSYRHLQFDKEKVSNVSRFERKKVEEIKIINSLNARDRVDGISDVSERQGSTLAGYLYGLGYSTHNWNSSFDNNAVNLDFKDEVIFEDIKIFILSPNTKKLKLLSNLWMNKLQEFDIDFNISKEEFFDDAYEMYMKKLKCLYNISEYSDVSDYNKSFYKILEKDILQTKKDKSKSNGASISFILEYDGKKALFLGDAHEDIIVENLKKYKQKEKNLEFEVVKISHHGSLKNNFNWIDMVKSKRYLISTNGSSHNHPNKEVIAKILKSNNEKKVLYFNYPLDICKVIDEKSLKDKYNYEIVTGNGSLFIEIGGVLDDK
nr:MBL fold metallo-hydrolase [uncultured Romboutsia sp.]